MTWTELQEAHKRARFEVRRTQELLKDAERAYDAALKESERIADLILAHKEPE